MVSSETWMQPFSEEILNVAIAERDAKIHPDGALNAE
jgi:hypothetical protein